MNGLDIELASYIDYLNSLNIKIAQYRNKLDNETTILKDLEILKSKYSGTLIINDYLKFINLADGLHLGQEDLAKIDTNFKVAVEKLRDIVDNKIIGLSTHNLAEINIANSLNIDYIGLGAYRQTTTKSNVEVSGNSLLDIAKKSKHKVALIGGVKLSDNFSKFPQISYKVIGSDLMKNFFNY